MAFIARAIDFSSRVEASRLKSKHTPSPPTLMAVDFGCAEKCDEF